MTKFTLQPKPFLALTLLFACMLLLAACKKAAIPQPPANSIFDHTYTVSTIAGNGTVGFKNGDALNAEFNMRYGIATDNLGNIYIADGTNNSIRKITAAGQVITLAGSGQMGNKNGAADSAQFNFPHGLAVDAAGNVFVADIFNNQIRKITPDGVVSTIAGTGAAGKDDDSGLNAKFNAPAGIAIDAKGNLWITDFNNGLIRKITTAGQVRTFPGIKLSGPEGIAVDADGNLYVVESGKSLIRKITFAGVLSTVAGSDPGGFADGEGSKALFFNPEGIAIDSEQNLYVSDLGNNRIRKITPAGMVSTVAGGAAGFQDGAGQQARFAAPSDIAIDGTGKLYVMDVNNHRVRKIEK